MGTYIEVTVDLDQVGKDLPAFKLELGKQLSVRYKAGSINKGSEGIVEEGDCCFPVGLCEEGLRTPHGQFPHQVKVAFTLLEVGSHDSLAHLLILQVLLREWCLCLLGKELPILLVVLIYFIEAVVGVHQDHVDELLEERSLEVEFQVLAESFIDPESCEYLVGVLPILEFLIELIGPASVGDATVEPDESTGEVGCDHLARTEVLVDEP